MNAEIDVRHVLPTIRVPTLVLHRVEDHLPIEVARWTAAQIPGARFVELPGGPHMPYLGDTESLVREIEAFVTGVYRGRRLGCARAGPRARDDPLHGHRRLDGEGGRARRPGWRELVEQHHALVRGQLARFRGRELDTAGDGFFASFDGPARAIRCACAITEGVHELGIEVRAGLHTGECEVDRGQGRRDRRAHRRARRGRGASRARCSSRARSRTSSPAPGSSSRSEARRR